jgi:hypothetical protein
MYKVMAEELSKEVVISIPRNYYNRSMFINGFKERRDLEQYFWTENTIEAIREALRYTFGPESSCCLCTPSLALNWWTNESQEVSLLDIDTRFKFLPKFRYFDLRDPNATDLGTDQHFWRVIVFDPPFFYIPMNVLYEAVIYVCNNRIEKTKLLMGFLKREEKTLLSVFSSFKLKRTNFPLEYSHVKPNKWRNYAMYSNVDLPGIKRNTN